LLSPAEVELLHRAHAAFVRRFLRRYRRSLQDADLEDIEQNVWLKVATRAKREGLDAPEAYLTTITKRAAFDCFRRKHRPCRDERKTEPLEGSAAVGLADARAANAAEVFDTKRTRCRVRALRSALSATEATTFDSVMAHDFDGAPTKEQTKVVAMVKRVLALPARPPSVEHPDPLDGPEHCGETVRRLRLVVDARDDISPFEDLYLDAAE
jgi:DNA-directed RNA polymerase specialized sigma24 family protein